MNHEQYQNDVLPLKGAGLSDTAVSQVLSGITNSPIRVDDARVYFRTQGLWQSSPPPSLTYKGKLETARNNPENSDSVRALLDTMWSAVYNNEAATCGTTILKDFHGNVSGSQQAGNVRYVINELTSTTQLSQADANGFYALGGGLKYPDGVSVAQIEEGRAAYDAEQTRLANEASAKQAADAAEAARQATRQAFQPYYNTHVAAAIDSDDVSKSSIIAALRACADAWESE